VVLLGVALLAGVAVGAHAASASASSALGASGAWRDALYAVLGLAAGMLGALLIVATIFGVFQRRRRGPSAREGTPQRPILALLLICGFALAVLWLLARAPRVKGGAAPHIVSSGATLATGAAAVPPPSSPTAALIGAVVGVLLVAAGTVVLLIRAQRARPRHAPPLGAPDEPSPLGAVDAALEALDSDADPRRAVIAAYATMERLLGAAGSPRRPADAPTEHLERSLVLLGSGGASARRLTELFERARFSVQTIDEQVRRSAFEALTAVRLDLERV
jgi:hypothetical protein